VGGAEGYCGGEEEGGGFWNCAVEEIGEGVAVGDRGEECEEGGEDSEDEKEGDEAGEGAHLEVGGEVGAEVVEAAGEKPGEEEAVGEEIAPGGGVDVANGSVVELHEALAGEEKEGEDE